MASIPSQGLLAILVIAALAQFKPVRLVMYYLFTAVLLIAAITLALHILDLPNWTRWLGGGILFLQYAAFAGSRQLKRADETLFCSSFLASNEGDVQSAREHWIRSYSTSPPRMTNGMEAWRQAWLAGFAAGKLAEQDRLLYGSGAQDIAE